MMDVDSPADVVLAHEQSHYFSMATTADTLIGEDRWTGFDSMEAILSVPETPIDSWYATNENARPASSLLPASPITPSFSSWPVHATHPEYEDIDYNTTSLTVIPAASLQTFIVAECVESSAVDLHCHETLPADFELIHASYRSGR